MATAPTQEKAEKAEKPKVTRSRAKTETIDVYRVREFELVAEGVEATGRGPELRRQAAIAKATADFAEADKAGTFVTASAGEIKIMTRKRKVEPVDEWEV